MFTVYLGSFASDVELIAIKLNENYLSVTDAIQQHYFTTKIPHINGTHSFIIKVPFEDKSIDRVVRGFILFVIPPVLYASYIIKNKIYFSKWQYLGEGLLQYSVEINYTLNIIGRNDTFFHHVSVVAHVNDACKS